ncbi:MAG: phosphoribosylamine--glycine ligase [Candidatus Brocadiales bacterium]
MKILIVGGGGREHSLAWKIAQSPLVEKIFCAPGNAGIAQVAECINICAEDISALYNFTLKKHIDLTVVGPEDPLSAGIVNKFDKGGLKIFGPSKRAAMIEGSKCFAKNIMRKHGIPTADFRIFDEPSMAKEYVSSLGTPVVIKADGLTRGKGVYVCKTEQEAFNSIDRIMKDKIFLEAGSRIVVEEYLTGEEVSILALTDGKTIVPLESAQDHKTAYDGDKGPNTGGMGAYSPVPFINREFYYRIEREILVPVVHAMKRENSPYKGVLYAGLMITSTGPKVLEFNARFGDPETQALIMRLKCDLVPLLLATVEENLDKAQLDWDERASVCVVMASKGYPEKYEKGKEIHGLEAQKGVEDVQIFHAGTTLKHGRIMTNGGRVLGVTALGSNVKEAQKRAYEVVHQISFEGAYFRTDIGAKAFALSGSIEGN